MTPATVEQHLEALERANEVRIRRARLKREIKKGIPTVAQFLSEPFPDWAEGMRLKELLGAEPLMGAKRMHRLALEASISPFGLGTRLGHLTGRQKASLVALLQQKTERAELKRARTHRTLSGGSRGKRGAS